MIACLQAKQSRVVRKIGRRAAPRTREHAACCLYMPVARVLVRSYSMQRMFVCLALVRLCVSSVHMHPKTECEHLPSR